MMPTILGVVTSLAAVPPTGAQAQSPRATPQPVVLIGDRVSIVSGTPHVLAAASDSAAVARALSACGVAMPGGAAMSPLADDGVPSTHLMFVVVARTPAPSRCNAAVTESAALLARGIRVMDAARSVPASAIVAASIHVGGGPSLADSVERRPAIAVTGSAPDARLPMTLVALVPATALRPDARGALPDVVVEVSLADSATHAERLTIYEYNVRRLWYQVMAGRLTDAARNAVERLDDRRLSHHERRIAQLTVADALLAGGDTSAARVPLADALHDAPCLTLASAPAAYARLLDEQRPRDVRCTVTPIRRVALASLVPGLGQAVTGHRAAAWQVAGGTALLGAASLALRMIGDARYDDYLDATDADLAEGTYGHAAEFRSASTGLAGAAGLAWLVGGLQAIRAERAHQREMTSQQNYDRRGARVSARVGPDIHQGALHMGVAFTW